MIRNQNVRLLLALLIGAAVTAGVYWLLGPLFSAVGMPLWAYLIIWAVLSGSALQALTAQAAHEATIARPRD